MNRFTTLFEPFSGLTTTFVEKTEFLDYLNTENGILLSSHRVHGTSDPVTEPDNFNYIWTEKDTRC